MQYLHESSLLLFKFLTIENSQSWRQIYNSNLTVLWAILDSIKKSCILLKPSKWCRCWGHSSSVCWSLTLVTQPERSTRALAHSPSRVSAWPICWLRRWGSFSLSHFQQCNVSQTLGEDQGLWGQGQPGCGWKVGAYGIEHNSDIATIATAFTAHILAGLVWARRRLDCRRLCCWRGWRVGAWRRWPGGTWD